MKRSLPTFFALIFFHFNFSGQQVGILDINNIRCNVSSTGNLFDRSGDDDLPGFEVPAGSGIRSIYAANLWMGGVTSESYLHMAAEMGGDEVHDWFPGPLTTGGTAETTPEVQAEYDRVWVANLSDVQDHITYFEAITSGLPDPFPGGYSMPEWFNEWPAHGDTGMGQSYYLAPFTDYNLNGIYDPENGDYPSFCGEKCVYFIFNDKGNVHTSTMSLPIGVEVHGMLYGFNSPENEMLNNTVFLKYNMINRGSLALSNTYAAIWTDFDLGNPTDDNVGANVLRSAVYAYNGDTNDEETSAGPGYGGDLAMQATVLLRGPYMNEDLEDNPLPDNLYSLETHSYGSAGHGYEDGYTDNEQWGLSRAISFEATPDPVHGHPTSGTEYYNYLRGLWKNGQIMEYGGEGDGTGTGATTMPCKYYMPGDSDPLQTGTSGSPMVAWTEQTAATSAGDRMAVASCGPFDLLPVEDYNYLDAAFVFARESDEPDEAVAQTLDHRIKEARDFFEYLVTCNGEAIPLNSDEIARSTNIILYPNPASSMLQVQRMGLATTEPLDISILNAAGQMCMYVVNLRTASVDISTLDPGVYHVKIDSGKTSVVKRIVVMH